MQIRTISATKILLLGSLLTMTEVKGHIEPTDEYNERYGGNRMVMLYKKYSPPFDVTEPIFPDPRVKVDKTIHTAKYGDPCNASRYHEIVTPFILPALEFNTSAIKALRAELHERVKADHHLARDICYSSNEGPFLMCGFNRLGYHGQHGTSTPRPGYLDFSDNLILPSVFNAVFNTCRCLEFFVYQTVWDPLRKKCVVPDGSPCSQINPDCEELTSLCVGSTNQTIQEFCLCESLQDDMLMESHCQDVRNGGEGVAFQVTLTLWVAATFIV